MSKHENVLFDIAFLPKELLVTLRRAGTIFALGVSSLAGTGCAADLGSAEADGEVEALSQPLSESAWRDFGNVANSPGFNIYYEEAALAANQTLLSGMGVRRNSSTSSYHQEYYFQTIQTYLQSGWQAWSGGTPQAPEHVKFSSPPTATHLRGYSNSVIPRYQNRFLVAGKDTNNRIRVLLGTAGGDPSATPTNPPPPPIPGILSSSGTVTWSSWGTLDSSFTYSGSDGYPALATGGVNQRVVLAFRAPDSQARQRIYAYDRAVSSSGEFSGSWSSRRVAPVLPTGITIQGTPGITFIGNAADVNYRNKFFIVARTAGNEVAWILYDGNGSWGSWNLASIPYSGMIDSDPVAEWDPILNFFTIYWIAYDNTDNIRKVLQQSVPDPSDIGGYPFAFIDRDESQNVFYAAPRVTFGGGVEATYRSIVVRGTTPSSGTSARSLIYSQDIPGYYYPPNTPFAP